MSSIRGAVAALVLTGLCAAPPIVMAQTAPDAAVLARANGGDAAAMRALAASYVAAQRASPSRTEAKRNETEAVKWLTAAAGKNDAAAMHELGVLYASRDVGEDPPPAQVAPPGEAFDRVAALFDDDDRDLTHDPNMMEAVRWFRKAADLGYAKGMFALGTSYADGTGVNPSEAEAVRWLAKAAELGDTDAMVNMGFYHTRGGVVHKDDAEALRWYRLAADKGNPVAMFTLGIKYHEGENGLSKNATEAVKWEKMAADKGYGPAMYVLARYYESGDGVEKSQVEAVRWYRLAAQNGSREAGEYLRQRGL